MTVAFPPSVSTAAFGFIGLGTMGYRMARNIRNKIPADSKLVVYDINSSVLKDFVKEFDEELAKNVIIASSPKEVANQVDILMSSVPYGHHVKSVYLDPETGVIGANVADRQLLILELSTIDTASAKEVREKIEASGKGVVIDAPCSGAVFGAEAATLSFMVGCPEELFPTIYDVLKMMGKPESIFRCGDHTAGLITKFLNNYLSACTTLATCEVFNIADKAGLDLKKLQSIINVSTGQNFNCSKSNPVPGLSPTTPSSKDYMGGFSVELCSGVIQNALKTSRELGASTVIADTVVGFYSDMCDDDRFKGKDYRIAWKKVSE